LSKYQKRVLKLLLYLLFDNLNIVFYTVYDKIHSHKEENDLKFGEVAGVMQHKKSLSIPLLFS